VAAGPIAVPIAAAPTPAPRPRPASGWKIAVIALALAAPGVLWWVLSRNALHEVLPAADDASAATVGTVDARPPPIDTAPPPDASPPPPDAPRKVRQRPDARVATPRPAPPDAPAKVDPNAIDRNLPPR
jgi:hypothetical protein